MTTTTTTEGDHTMTTTTPSQLRRAAITIAQRRHPDQACTILPTAYSRRRDHYAEVRTTGDSVLVLRSEAEAQARGARYADLGQYPPADLSRPAPCRCGATGASLVLGSDNRGTFAEPLCRDCLADLAAAQTSQLVTVGAYVDGSTIL